MAYGTLRYKAHKPPIAEDLGSYVDGDGERYVEQGNECHAAIDAAIASGIAADTMVEVRGLKLTLAEGKTQHCQALIDFGTALEPLIDGEAEAARKKLYAKYEELGVKGDRLELFAYYDNTSFYMKGCQYTVDEIADLVKAKVLFHWLDNSDGSITIRKYKFKGNTYKVTEKVYWRPDKAYRGCK